MTNVQFSSLCQIKGVSQGISEIHMKNQTNDFIFLLIFVSQQIRLLWAKQCSLEYIYKIKKTKNWLNVTIPFWFSSLILYISKIILKAAVARGSKRLFIKSLLHQNWLPLAFPHRGFKCLEIFSWRGGWGTCRRENLFTCSSVTVQLYVS